VKAAICTIPYGVDNELNKWGDYIALLRIFVEYDDAPYSRTYWLIGKPGTSPVSITREQFLSACENLAIQSGATAFIPKPV